MRLIQNPIIIAFLRFSYKLFDKSKTNIRYRLLCVAIFQILLVQ